MTDPHDEAGLATLTFPLLLWVAVVAAVVLVDIGAYLVAAARAQQLADGAALAAVSVDAEPASGGPHGEAERVVALGGGRLERCACRSGSEQAEVTVSMRVPGLVVPRLGAARVAAEAAAVLAQPEPLGAAQPRRPLRR
ncbi:pilus assembly protein TadG-related protein [Egicoccus sp. AB-alg6-2]|uniref:pilus assembly protein TadG-related protein n=1 Tax=Egicoccus sp. AB-alg6-2 TaxID=3242692 RepID=UPI00359D206F